MKFFSWGLGLLSTIRGRFHEMNFSASLKALRAGSAVVRSSHTDYLAPQRHPTLPLPPKGPWITINPACESVLIALKPFSWILPSTTMKKAKTLWKKFHEGLWSKISFTFWEALPWIAFHNSTLKKASHVLKIRNQVWDAPCCYHRRMIPQGPWGPNCSRISRPLIVFWEMIIFSSPM